MYSGNEENLEVSQEPSEIGDENVDAVLIEKIHLKPALWYLKSPYYSKTQITDGIWRDIATEIGVPAYVLKRRWKNLKNSYSSEKKKRREELTKSGSAGPAKRRKRPGFALYPNMQFLERNSEAKAKSVYNNVRLNSSIHAVAGESVFFNENLDSNSTFGGNAESEFMNADNIQLISDIEENSEELITQITSHHDVNRAISPFIEILENNSDETSRSGVQFQKLSPNVNKDVLRHVNKDVLPQSPALPSPWILAGSSRAVQPTSCNISARSKKVKSDPLIDTVNTLSSMVVRSFENEEKKKEGKHESEENFNIPVRDVLFGKTIAAEIAQISDSQTKEIKKGIIMSVIYSPISALNTILTSFSGLNMPAASNTAQNKDMSANK